MKEKQLSRISPRVSDSLKKEFEDVAKHYGPNPSAVVKSLIQALIEGHNKHPGRLVWPIELNFHPEKERATREK